MRASTGAAVGVVTKLMDVEASLRIWVMAGDIPADGGRGVLIGLLESHLASDLGVSSEDGNWRVWMLDTVEEVWLVGGLCSTKRGLLWKLRADGSRRRADKMQTAASRCHLSAGRGRGRIESRLTCFDHIVGMFW